MKVKLLKRIRRKLGCLDYNTVTKLYRYSYESVECEGGFIEYRFDSHWGSKENALSTYRDAFLHYASITFLNQRFCYKRDRILRIKPHK